MSDIAKNVRSVARHVKNWQKRKGIKWLSLAKNMAIGRFGHHCCPPQQKMENANAKRRPARTCNRCVTKPNEQQSPEHSQ